MSDLPDVNEKTLLLCLSLLRSVLPNSLELTIWELQPHMQEVPRPPAVDVLRTVLAFETDAELRLWICEKAPLGTLLLIGTAISVLDHWLRVEKDPSDVETFAKQLRSVPTAGWVLGRALALIGTAEAGGSS